MAPPPKKQRTRHDHLSRLTHQLTLPDDDSQQSLAAKFAALTQPADVNR